MQERGEEGEDVNPALCEMECPDSPDTDGGRPFTSPGPEYSGPEYHGPRCTTPVPEYNTQPATTSKVSTSRPEDTVA